MERQLSRRSIRTLVTAILGDASLARRNDGKFNLPVTALPAKQFADKARDALKDPRARVYVDTSLLTWLTKVGSTSRKEFLDWITEWCGERIVVPAWSAHEFYRHHVAGTVTNELTDQINLLRKVGAESYGILHPFLDQLPGDTSAKRTRVREALAALSGVTEVFDDIRRNHQNSASDVVEFINKFAMPRSCVFDSLDGIEGLSEARFTGRIPPGFQDRNKQSPTAIDDRGEFHTGTNRWGDLMFWREILNHAKVEQAKSIIILSRDTKNDWRMGGLLRAAAVEDETGEINESPKTLESPVHPTLAYEALMVADVDTVLLLDNSRLAMIAQTAGLAPSFTSVAVSPAPIQPRTEKQIRKDEADLRTRYEVEAEKKLASRSGFRFLDPPEMSALPAKLNLLLLKTRKVLTADLSAECRQAEGTLVQIIAGEGTIEEVLNRETVQRLGPEDFVRLIRRIGEKALTEPGYDIVAADVVAMLEKLPPATSSHIYLGLLAAMYLREGNKARGAPRSPVALQLLRLRHEGYARAPIQVIGTVIATHERRPLYFPSHDDAVIHAKLYADSELEPKNQLVEIWLGGQQLITEDQGDDELRFATRLGKAKATAQELIELASEIFCVPTKLIATDVSFDTEFLLSEYLGYKDPSEVWVTDNRENEDG